MKIYEGEIKRIKETIKQRGNSKLSVEKQYLSSLLEITRSINVLQDFNQLLQHIVDLAVTLSKAERGFLMLIRDNGSLEFTVTRNIDKETIEGEEFKISRTVVNQALAAAEPVFLSDIYRDDKFKISESIEALGLRMIMCVPLKAKESLLGLLYVDSHSKTESFTRLEEKMFEAFAAQASIALENSHLYDLSVHDALTGLYNYGYLRARLEEEIVRSSRHKKEHTSFIMLDLDNFKMINDSHGHLFGNSILVKVAELIKTSVRKYDIAARYGGDEFAILMPDAGAKEARYLALRLKNEITDLKFLAGEEKLSISLSIGITSFPAGRIADTENIIVEADHALFTAKRKGGNQIAVYGLRKDHKKESPEFIGKSKAINEIKKTSLKIAKTDATVLITGETGTGKELIANLIHQQSHRTERPFIVVNCGAIPDNLLESELFGYEKGAFTGAIRQHRGKFESAHGGTIFFDEIGELPLHLQVKILRAIEQKEIDRVGGKSTIKVNVRVIAASNRNLENEVQRRTFRKDLFYRLSVATIYIPPLRERPEDIEAITNYYLERINKQYGRSYVGFTKTALEAMMRHPWPGNVREAIHRIERAIIMGTGKYLDSSDIGLVSPQVERVKSLKKSRDTLEKDSITQALMYNHWNITQASKQLGITRGSLRYLIKKHNIVKLD